MEALDIQELYKCKIIKLMKSILSLFILFMLILTVVSCKTVKQINKVIALKDTIAVVSVNQSEIDSLLLVKNTLQEFKKYYINFNTFSAKIKVEIQNSKGKQPDVTAVVKMIKDSAIWMSLSASILNIEIYRVLITKDSVILLNKQDKEVQYRSLDYLQEVTEIPFDFKTMQNMLIGNPVFLLDSNIVYFKKADNKILISFVGDIFKHLITLNDQNYLLMHSKLDDADLNRHRTADLRYSDYENKMGFNFSTYREITVSEKNKLDINLHFKQYEFNKELSVHFNIPKNYSRK